MNDYITKEMEITLDNSLLCHTCGGCIQGREPNWLQCNSCKNYFHISCMKRQCTPGAIYGDVFFIFTCSECSTDNIEIFERERMTWIQIIVLILYHMQHTSLRNGPKGFFHWRTHIVSFIDQKWHVLFPKDKRKKNWMGTVSGCLSHYSNTFVTSGQTLLGETGWWKLTFPDLTPKLTVLIHGAMLARKSSDVKNEYNDYEYLIQLIKKYAPHVCTDVQSLIKQENITDDNSHNIIDSKLINEIKTEEVDINIHHDMQITKVLQESFKETKIIPKIKVNDIKSLFSKSPRTDFKIFCKKDLIYNDLPYNDLLPLSPSLERLFLREIYDMTGTKIGRFKRKLILRSLKRSQGIPLFNIDHAPRDRRFSHYLKYPGECLAREVRIAVGTFYLESFVSPYTTRLLRPFIRRDFKTQFPWLKLMAELQMRVHKGQNWNLPPRHPVDFCYVKPQHIPAINSLCERYFWPGIDLAETLEYPEFSIVAMYRRLVIGFAFMVPDVKFNESYISFIFTLPTWRNCGLAKFMIYHLIQTCMGKDVTLHVAVDNPAIFLYQKFGFKVEEVSFDFYESYIRHDSKQSRHAFFMRLER